MSYGQHQVLDRVSLEVSPGEIYGLLGSNGSGKSTLLRIVAGAIRPLAGDVVVRGPHGYVAQTFALYEDLPVAANIEFFGQCAGLRGHKLTASVHEVMDRVGLLGVRNQPTSQLSHGWRQRLKLAVALCNAPSVLLLDEVTAGIDPIARQDLWQILKTYARSGMAILLSTHHMDEAARCDRVGYLKDGSLLFSDSPAVVRARGQAAAQSDLAPTAEFIDGVQAVMRDHRAPLRAVSDRIRGAG